MTTGPSKDFRIKINRQAVAEIVHSAYYQARSLENIRTMVSAGAPVEDVRAAQLLVALVEYLEERRCVPDFELVLSE